MDNRAVVGRLWELIEARRWDDAGTLLREDVVVSWPHTGEVIRGRANYIELNRHYPEGWHIELLTLLASGERVCAELRVPHQTLGVSFAACFYDVPDGVIQRGTEYWVDERSQRPPSWRAQWTERG